MDTEWRITGQSNGLVFIKDVQGKDIAKVGVAYEEITPEVEDHARLIASAPTLKAENDRLRGVFEAAEAMRDRYACPDRQNGDGTETPCGECEWCQLRQAIEKAEKE